MHLSEITEQRDPFCEGDLTVRPSHVLSASELDEHVANIDRDGYTIIRNQIAAEKLDPLRDIAQRAADDYIAAWRGGMKLREVHIGGDDKDRKFDLNPNARVCFLWGDEAIDLLDHDTVHAIAERCIGTYHFHDLVIQYSTLQSRYTGWRISS